MAISVATATVLGLFLACIFYGIFVVLYIVSVLFWIKRSSNRPFFTLATSTILFIFNTVYIAVEMSYTLDGLTGSTSYSVYFAQTGQWRELFATALILSTLLLADSMLVYRLWIIWTKDWRIVFIPIILWFAGFGIISTAFYELVMVSGEGKTLFAPAFSRFTKATCGYTLVQNFLATGLILYKIWTAHSRHTEGPGSTLKPVIHAILESGSLYAATVLVLLVLDVTGSNAYYVILLSIAPIIGIVFTLLLVRVGMRTAKESRAYSSETRSVNSSMPTSTSGQPISISVTRALHSDEEVASKEGKSRFRAGSLTAV